MNQKFKKQSPGHNPVNIFNKKHKPHELIHGDKSLKIDDDGNILCCGDDFLMKKNHAYIRVPSVNGSGNIPVKCELSPFQVLCELRFKRNYKHAITYIEHEYMNKKVNYIRVRTNYFKRITKENNWGIDLENLVPWKKDTLKDDYGKGILNQVNTYDDFTIVPDNMHYQPVINTMWNLYEPFPHKPSSNDVSVSDIPHTASFMAHVFGEQVEMGYKYLKVLYEKPKQILPVLVLVSKERATGKTSFLNWMDIIFGNNYTQISPTDMDSQFNSQYAYRNIIGIDEAVINKKTAVEKIKSVATARTILVNQKQIAQYRIPFYGKIIITTNKEIDFMRVDQEEIRFWVRKLSSIPEEDISNDFFDNLIEEIPDFLKYLNDLEDIEYGRSRMVFTRDELENDLLKEVKKESRSGLQKDIEIHVQDWFEKNPSHDVLYMRLMDIKDNWFEHNTRASPNYIKKVLKEEIEAERCEMGRYKYLGWGDSIPGKPYKFTRKDAQKTVESVNEVPF